MFDGVVIGLIVGWVAWESLGAFATFEDNIDFHRWTGGIVAGVSVLIALMMFMVPTASSEASPSKPSGPQWVLRARSRCVIVALLTAVVMALLHRAVDTRYPNAQPIALLAAHMVVGIGSTASLALLLNRPWFRAFPPPKRSAQIRYWLAAMVITAMVIATFRWASTLDPHLPAFLMVSLVMPYWSAIVLSRRRWILLFAAIPVVVAELVLVNVADIPIGTDLTHAQFFAIYNVHLIGYLLVLRSASYGWTGWPSAS